MTNRECQARIVGSNSNGVHGRRIVCNAADCPIPGLLKPVNELLEPVVVPATITRVNPGLPARLADEESRHALKGIQSICLDTRN